MLQDFLTYLSHELNRSPLTVTAYATDIEQFMKWIEPNPDKTVDFTSVASSDVRAWLAFMAKDGNTPRTLRRKIISLRTFYKWMLKTGKIKHSPLQEVLLPKISKPLPDLVKPEEIEEAIACIEEKEDDDPEDLMNALIISMLYSLGLRRAELVGINENDVYFDKAEMKVTGKRSKQRILPVPQQLLDNIARWISSRPSVIDEKGNSPLFIYKGKRITVDKVYRIVNKSLEGSSARKKSPHALRHSFASGMLNGGAEIDSVREFLGHSSLATTQIYTHISLKEIKRAYLQAHPRSHKDFER